MGIEYLPKGTARVSFERDHVGVLDPRVWAFCPDQHIPQRRLQQHLPYAMNYFAPNSSKTDGR